MITSTEKEAIIDSGIAFMRTITSTYGAEEGMKLWEKIAEVLDPSLKGDIFFALITGKYTGNLRVKLDDSYDPRTFKKINAIKAVRMVDITMGLKEAKDFVEEMMQFNNVKSITIGDGNISNARRELENNGFIVL